MIGANQLHCGNDLNGWNDWNSYLCQRVTLFFLRPAIVAHLRN